MVLSRHSNIPEAYKTLGIEEGSSLDAVKSSYKKLALNTHPDKNLGNADATAQFQKVSEAYNILVKHLDKSTRPPRERAFPRGGPFEFGFGSPGEDDEGQDDFDEYDDGDYEEYDEDIGYYMFMFEEFLRGRASRFTQARYHRFHRPEPESAEQYQERLRLRREEQVAAEERRAKEDIERKIRLEKEREQERREAEKRQKIKKANKKGQAEASRKKAEDAARMQQQRAQTSRSMTFAAARANNVKQVEKGVYEDNVDAAGGEVKKGCEEFVIPLPTDPKETLTHIAVKHGNTHLVKWLDLHCAEPDECDSQGLTAFHLAVQLGHIEIMQTPFFDNYPPKESEHSAIYNTPNSTSLLALALDSCEPEVVWMIHDRGLATSQDINNAWTSVSAGNWKAVMKKKAASAGRVADDKKLDEIRQLLMVFGSFTPPPTPTVGAEGLQWESSIGLGPSPQNSSGGPGRLPPKQQKKGGKGPLAYEQPVSSPQTQANGASSPQPKTSMNGNVRGRGRGRGRGYGRYK